MKSDNLVQMDNQWKEYVNADPDLRRMEDHKRRTAYGRLVAKAYARQLRVERRREWRQAFVDFLTMALVSFLTVTALTLLALL